MQIEHANAFSRHGVAFTLANRKVDGAELEFGFLFDSDEVLDLPEDELAEGFVVKTVDKARMRVPLSEIPIDFREDERGQGFRLDNGIGRYALFLFRGDSGLDRLILFDTRFRGIKGFMKIIHINKSYKFENKFSR